MKEKATIRVYVNKDKEKVIELLRLNTPKYFSPEEEKNLIHYLDNEIELYYVLELENRIIGSGGINFKEDNNIGYISWDFLHPEFQGQGLGTMILNYRIDILQEYKSIKKIIIRTTQLVYRFYEKAGFKVVEQVKDYWAEGFDMYKMEYRLRRISVDK